jgi:hypothetical protein
MHYTIQIVWFDGANVMLSCRKRKKTIADYLQFELLTPNFNRYGDNARNNLFTLSHRDYDGGPAQSLPCLSVSTVADISDRVTCLEGSSAAGISEFGALAQVNPEPVVKKQPHDTSCNDIGFSVPVAVGQCCGTRVVDSGRLNDRRCGIDVICGIG